MYGNGCPIGVVVADQFATQMKERHGPDSRQYHEALDNLDNAIASDAMSSDNWTDAEMRAMDGTAI